MNLHIRAYNLIFRLWGVEIATLSRETPTDAQLPKGSSTSARGHPGALGTLAQIK